MMNIILRAPPLVQLILAIHHPLASNCDEKLLNKIGITKICLKGPDWVQVDTDCVKVLFNAKNRLT